LRGNTFRKLHAEHYWLQLGNAHVFEALLRRHSGYVIPFRFHALPAEIQELLERRDWKTVDWETAKREFELEGKSDARKFHPPWAPARVEPKKLYTIFADLEECLPPSNTFAEEVRFDRMSKPAGRRPALPGPTTTAAIRSRRRKSPAYLFAPACGVRPLITAH
jgi:hypothetical protein